MDRRQRPPALQWTAAGSIGTAVVAASLASLGALWGLSWAGAHDAVADALSDHLVAEAALVGQQMRGVPVDVLARLGAGHASDAVSDELGRLIAASGLHDAALLGPPPDQVVLGSGGTWLTAAADRDLVDRARAGAGVAGPLYRADDGALYLAAYAPAEGHPGWVVAVEGSATLGAVDRLARRQLAVSAAVLAVVTGVGAVLARWVARPLVALEADLERLEPGDPPEAVVVAGPREVVKVGEAVRRLLAAIRDRDAAVDAAHRAQVAQVTRLAAEIAHEIRNPLNAMSLSIGRLAVEDARERRATLGSRLRAQVDELEAIVGRLVDVTRPVEPQLEDAELGQLADEVAAEADDTEGVAVEVVRVDGEVRLRTDPTLVREILRNLVLNAVQARARRVWVRVGQPGWVEVEDDGAGVTDPEHLFDWFHTTRAKGSGLGLPASRRMAEGLGGALTLRAARPAVFRLELCGPSPLSALPGGRA